MVTGTAAVSTERLWDTYTARRDRETREKLILQYAPLVKYVIGRLTVPMTGVVDLDDIVSYGTLGLMEAVDRYDPSRGVTFQTYAMQRIRGAIIDALRKLDRVPRTVREKTRAIDRARQELETDLRRTPTREEVRERAGLSNVQYRRALANSGWATVSLDELLDGNTQGDGNPAVEGYPPGEEAEVSAGIEHRELLKELAGAIEGLPNRERTLLGLYYQEGLTMREIARTIDMSESRVCQLHRRAIEKLRASLSQAFLPD